MYGLTFPGFNLAQYFPNLKPGDQYLPASDYSRTGALRFAAKYYQAAIKNYVEAKKEGASGFWGNLGECHYYRLARNRNLKKNTGIRIGLPDIPEYGGFQTPAQNVTMDTQFATYQSYVLEDIASTAATYGFSVQVMLGAVVTLIEDYITTSDGAYIDGLPGIIKMGAGMAHFNTDLIKQFWGTAGVGFPDTYYSKGGGGAIFSREAAKGGKGKKNKRKRRRY